MIRVFAEMTQLTLTIFQVNSNYRVTVWGQNRIQALQYYQSRCDESKKIRESSKFDFTKFNLADDAWVRVNKVACTPEI
jgi:hypothetical protein